MTSEHQGRIGWIIKRWRQRKLNSEEARNGLITVLKQVSASSLVSVLEYGLGRHYREQHR